MSVEPKLDDARDPRDVAEGPSSADPSPSPVATVATTPRFEDPLVTGPVPIVDSTSESGEGSSADRDEPVAAAPTTRRGRRREERLQARQVRRIIRRIDLWSVLRVSLVFYICLWVILVVAGVILWRVAVSAGAIDRVERFIAELLAEKSFTIDGGQILRASAISGAILIFAGTGFTVLLTLLFNLINDLVGGVKITVLELETARPSRRARRRERRRAEREADREPVAEGEVG